MSDRDSPDVFVELAKLGERIEGMRDAVRDSEERIRGDIDRTDKRINGRIFRVEEAVGDLEREVYSEKVFLARVQGAAEERERSGLPPDPLPPPVPNGSVQAEPPAATVPRWVQVVVGLTAAIAGLLGAVATLAPLIEAVAK